MASEGVSEEQLVEVLNCWPAATLLTIHGIGGRTASLLEQNRPYPSFRELCLTVGGRLAANLRKNPSILLAVEWHERNTQSLIIIDGDSDNDGEEKKENIGQNPSKIKNEGNDADKSDFDEGVEVLLEMSFEQVLKHKYEEALENDQVVSLCDSDSDSETTSATNSLSQEQLDRIQRNREEAKKKLQQKKMICSFSQGLLSNDHPSFECENLSPPECHPQISHSQRERIKKNREIALQRRALHHQRSKQVIFQS